MGIAGKVRWCRVQERGSLGFPDGSNGLTQVQVRGGHGFPTPATLCRKYRTSAEWAFRWLFPLSFLGLSVAGEGQSADHCPLAPSLRIGSPQQGNDIRRSSTLQARFGRRSRAAVSHVIS